MQLNDSFDSKHEVSNEIYYAVLLHEHPELLDDCCELINGEWERSHVARLRSLNSSSSDFPTNVLLVKESEKPEVIGHCKLSNISRSSQVIFVQTVVIHPKYRGKGLGRLLMQKAENYLKRKGIQYVYLTTEDKILFYEKLGYAICEPINIYDSQFNFMFDDADSATLTLGEKTKIEECTEKQKSLDTFKCSIISQQSLPVSSPPPPPPPPPPVPIPPPLPPKSSFSSSTIPTTNKKTFMRKRII